MTARALLDDAVARMDDAGLTSPRRNAEWLLCETMGASRSALLSRLDEPVSPSTVAQFTDLLERRLGHEPLQYILGYTEFYGLRLNVSPDVLIPRPETEQVVEEGLRMLESRSRPRVLDVGTGSGCIAIAVKAQRRDAAVWACDVSERALAVARSNALRHELDVEFFQADALADDFEARAPRDLDLLISNPPYVPEGELADLPREVGEFEPHLALIATHDPLIFYRRIAVAGIDHLRPGGSLVFETHADFGAAAASVLEETGYENVALMTDYSDRPRILCAQRPKSSI